MIIHPWLRSVRERKVTTSALAMNSHWRGHRHISFSHFVIQLFLSFPLHYFSHLYRNVILIKTKKLDEVKLLPLRNRRETLELANSEVLCWSERSSYWMKTNISRKIDNSSHVLHVSRRRFKTNCKSRSFAPALLLCVSLLFPIPFKLWCRKHCDFVTREVIKTIMKANMMNIPAAAE